MSRWRAFLAVVLTLVLSASAQDVGTWKTLLNNAGISSMHTAVMHYDKVMMLDRTNVGKSQILLPNGLCRIQPLEKILTTDCTAHSVMFDPSTNTVRPLFIKTDTWCSSGAFFSDGTLVQSGGDFEGNKKVRSLAADDWTEDSYPALAAGRWYASNHILPEGDRMIVVGGRGAPSYEFVPKRSAGEGKFDLPLLLPGKDNLYPYVALLPDGNFWIFASRSSCLLNYRTGKVVRSYPDLPGKTRNYPAAGSMTLLPLSHRNGFQVAEVLICGGADDGYNFGKNRPAQKSCGRMTVTDAAAAWVMEDMPEGRIMGDMALLPDGNVLIINGAKIGSQGWGTALQPSFQPCLYATYDAVNRFQLLAPTTVPRMYHSTANMLSDGRILLAGSNTHQYYTFVNTPFPTELRVEAFSPPYLSVKFNDQRPVVTVWPKKMSYGRVYFVSFLLLGRRFKKRDLAVECNLNSAPFVTHSYAQGQRQLKLKTVLLGRDNEGDDEDDNRRGGRKGGRRGDRRRDRRGGKLKVWTVMVTSPPNNVVAPSQYYMMFVVVNGTPGKAQWVRVMP